MLASLDYVGVLAIEFFEQGGRLVANEMAPRVHNSGHWTIEGAETSQFENHLRGLLGLPLGSTETPVPCAMVNLIGTLPRAAAVLAVARRPPAPVRQEARPGRKLGHVTMRATTPELLRERLASIRNLLPAGD